MNGKRTIEKPRKPRREAKPRVDSASDEAYSETIANLYHSSPAPPTRSAGPPALATAPVLG